MKNFNEAYPATEGWSLTSKADEVAGKLIVTVTLSRDGQSLRSVPIEADEGVEKAYLRARELLIESLAIGEAGNQSSKTKAKGKGKGKPRAKPDNAFPDPDAPIPEPDEIKPLAGNGSNAGPKVTSVPDREPGQHAGEEKPDAGLISVLKDVCEAEGIEYREPETAEQATNWIFAIQQDGARELTDDLKPSESPSTQQDEAEEEVADAS